MFWRNDCLKVWGSNRRQRSEGRGAGVHVRDHSNSVFDT
jgi:hypothetical protein